jgi:cell division transport system ATP-binding protein
MALVSYKNVTKVYDNDCLVLDNISFDVNDDEFVSIVGKSGVGKTTLLKLLFVEEKPTKGAVYFNEQNISEMNSNEIAILRRKVGVVFQDFKLLPKLTAYENIAFALEVGGYSDEKIKEEVPEVLKLVGLSDKANNFPHQMSIGEKQRISIARAIIQKPDILVADEPTGNLDPINTWEIIRLLLKINELGTAVILSTHDKEIVNTLGRRVITLENGLIVRDEEKGKYIL